ncbi:hypothetical protein F183_A02260 [Bryobacterales bacterium F-183]|nr:hypothetical protein F183_A02260 [Bryobacterales bacterium F-183]
MLQQHWETVYGTKAPDQVSWFRPHLETSLRLIERAAGGNRAARIVDMGGGASTLPDDLVRCGYTGLTVVDISQKALDVARRRLSGDAMAAVRWVCGDATTELFAARSVDVWHDRAVFHFLTSEEARQAYVRHVRRAMRPGGHVIVGTFGPEGPLKCSGLDVVRYDAGTLHGEFGGAFRLMDSLQEIHETPWGSQQQFVYCYCSVE